VARKETRKTVAKTPDIRTVAALAKVSIATVSRTINGSPVVSDRLQARLAGHPAVELLSQHPCAHLVSGRSRLLGIIVENITNPFFPELIQSFEEIAVAHGYEILVSSSNSDPALLTRCVRRMLERKVDGVAVMTFGEEEPVLDQLVHHNIPMVLAEFRLDDPKTSTILLDYSTGIHAAVDHLAELGHSQDRLPRRPAQAALGHHPRKRLPHGDGSRRAAHPEEVDHRVRPHAQGRRGRLWQLQALATRPPPSSAPTT
jgi:hypothetical protein